MNIPSEEEAQSRTARVNNNNNIDDNDADPGRSTSNTTIRVGQLSRIVHHRDSGGDKVDTTTSTELKSQQDEPKTKLVGKGTGKKQRKGGNTSNENETQQEEETINTGDPSPYDDQMEDVTESAPTSDNTTIVQKETSSTTDPNEQTKDLVPEKKGKVNWKKPGVS